MNGRDTQGVEVATRDGSWSADKGSRGGDPGRFVGRDTEMERFARAGR
jgi:hypothetical protein